MAFPRYQHSPQYGRMAFVRYQLSSQYGKMAFPLQEGNWIVAYIRNLFSQQHVKKPFQWYGKAKAKEITSICDHRSVSRVKVIIKMIYIKF
jgi:hypothetical protein